MQPYTLLSNLLDVIEERLRERPDIDELASLFSLSSVHLQRIFKFAFGVTLASYIRSRMLSTSLVELLQTNLNIIDIAYEYGFEHEQSYIRSFKREFGVTPGEYRNSVTVTTITPPLSLLPAKRLPDGVLFGPDIVMVPQFHVIGKRHRVPFHDSVAMPPRVAKQFWLSERTMIVNAMHPDVYIGLTRIPAFSEGWSYYLPSIQVKDLQTIPGGMYGDTFPASLCARFHYIGQHHYYNMDVEMARGMYDAIVAFANDQERRYQTLNQSLYFERIDTSAYDGTYCQLEWFTPIREKSTL